MRADQPRTLAVISATRRPNARAMARSSGLGCNSPCPPTIVVLALGSLPPPQTETDQNPSVAGHDAASKKVLSTRQFFLKRQADREYRDAARDIGGGARYIRS